MAVFSELQHRNTRRGSPGGESRGSGVCAGLGDKEQVFCLARRDFQVRTGRLLFITILPDYDTRGPTLATQIWYGELEFTHPGFIN